MNGHEALNAGLLANYAGNISPSKIEILGLEAKTVETDLGDGWRYTDQWFGSLKGGGREVVVDKNEVGHMRVYAGGTVVEAVSSAGLQKSDVIGFLIESIQARPTTRLDTLESYQRDNWQYTYTPTAGNPDLKLATGTETILYNSVLVFQHNFLISPVL